MRRSREFADWGQALSNLDQSYSFQNYGTVNSLYVDTLDFCDGPDNAENGICGSKCVNVCAPSSSEQ